MQAGNSTWFYFQAVFWCHHCKHRYVRMARTKDPGYFEALSGFSDCACTMCNSVAESELLSFQELPIQYLEEFMRWT